MVAAFICKLPGFTFINETVWIIELLTRKNRQTVHHIFQGNLNNVNIPAGTRGCISKTTGCDSTLAVCLLHKICMLRMIHQFHRVRSSHHELYLFQTISVSYHLNFHVFLTSSLCNKLIKYYTYASCIGTAMTHGNGWTLETRQLSTGT